MSIQAVLFHPGRRVFTLVTAPADKMTAFSTPETFENLLRAMLSTLPAWVNILVVGRDLKLNNPYSYHHNAVLSLGKFLATICGYPGYMERLQRDYLESLDTTVAAVAMARFRYHTAALRATKRIPPYLEVASFFGGPDAVSEFMRELHLPDPIDPSPVLEPVVLEEIAEMPLGVSVIVNEGRKFCGLHVDSRLFGNQPHTYEGTVVVPVYSWRWSEGRAPGQRFLNGPSTKYWEWPVFSQIVRNALNWCQNVSAMKRKFPALPGEPLHTFDEFFKHPRVQAKIQELGLTDALQRALEVM